jgi:hypothetical protein
MELVATGLLIVVGMAVVLYVRLRATVYWVGSIRSQLEPSTRPIAIIASCVTIGITIALAVLGLAVPAALVTGAFAGGGVFVVAVGVLGLEGILLETESAAALRQSQGEPPASSARGRAAAIAIGSVLLGLAFAACFVVVRG